MMSGERKGERKKQGTKVTPGRHREEIGGEGREVTLSSRT